MDRAGSHALKLGSEELESVFDLVAKDGSRKDALSKNPGRNKNTIYRAFGVSAEFERRKLDAITTETAEEVADKVGYSIGASYVSDLFLKWMEWKRNQRVEESRELKAKGAEGGHKAIKDWIAEEFERAVIVKEALRQELQSRVRRAFSDGFIGVILPTYPYGPVEREIVRSINQRDTRLHDAFSDLDAALRNRDEARAELAVEEIFRILDEWITL